VQQNIAANTLLLSAAKLPTCTLRGSRPREAAPGRGDFWDGRAADARGGRRDHHRLFEVSVVGITEVLKRLPSLFRAMSRLVNEAERRRPPLAILTDFPGFHLRLARKLRPKGIRNVYYICPQLWAWRPWRVNLVRRRFAQALCIFHFEEKVLRRRRRAGEIRRASACRKREGHTDSELFCRKYGLEQENPVITILPGSRWGRSPTISGTGRSACGVGTDLPGSFGVVVAVAPGLDSEKLKGCFQHSCTSNSLSRHVQRASDGGPGDRLQRHGQGGNGPAWRTDDCCLPALSADRPAGKTAGKNQVFQHGKFDRRARSCPELIQDDFTPRRVAAEAENCFLPRTKVRSE